MNYYPLALVILLAFAGGWVWRGVFDLWRHPKAKVYGTTRMVLDGNPSNWSGTFAAPATVTWTEPPDAPPKLRAVE